MLNDKRIRSIRRFFSEDENFLDCEIMVCSNDQRENSVQMTCDLCDDQCYLSMETILVANRKFPDISHAVCLDCIQFLSNIPGVFDSATVDNSLLE